MENNRAIVFLPGSPISMVRAALSLLILFCRKNNFLELESSLLEVERLLEINN